MARSLSDLGTFADRKFGVMGRTPAKCETHGDYLAVVLRGAESHSGCPDCAAIKREKAELAHQQAEFRITQRAVAGIPKRFATKTFSDFVVECAEQQVALDACVGYVDGFAKHRQQGRCMLLLGKVGTGKTHLAVAAINRLINEQMVRAIYRTAGAIMGDIKASFREHSVDTEASILRRVIGADLLVLDEIGATKQSEFELVTLFSIINGRYEQCRPTIIVSNLSPSELNDALGVRCVDRLRENGCIGVPFEWQSQRGRESACA